LNLRPLPCEGNALPINPIESIVCRVRPELTRFVRQFPGRKWGGAQTVPALSVKPTAPRPACGPRCLAGLSRPRVALVRSIIWLASRRASNLIVRRESHKLRHCHHRRVACCYGRSGPEAGPEHDRARHEGRAAIRSYRQRRRDAAAGMDPCH
jgi:hypothetical protein